MNKYILLSTALIFFNAANADVPMIIIQDGTKNDAEQVIALASSSISNINNPEQAHKEIYQQGNTSENINEFVEDLVNKARNKKPETSISAKYKPIYDHIDKQLSLAHRHTFHPNYRMNEQLKKEFTEKWRQERLKQAKLEYAEIKARNTTYYKDSEKALLSPKLVEAFRPTVPNIDEIRESFFIYTCAPYVARLSRKVISQFEYEETKGIPYQVFGQNQIEKNLLASPDHNHSFQYASSILYDEVTPNMPSFKFWNKLNNYHAIVNAYVNYLSIDEVKQFNEQHCVRYEHIVNK